MITAAEILRPVTPMHAWEIAGEKRDTCPSRYEKRPPRPNTGIRQACIDALTDAPQHTSKIAAQIGYPPKNTNIELSRIARYGLAYRCGNGFYRKVSS